jgi:hypothetical protein
MEEQALRERIKRLLLSNINDGYSKLLKTHYCYIKPSPGTYPFQFWWDTCFHVFILCALGEYTWAKKNILSLFAMQEDDGFVGHMIFGKKVLPRNKSDILQSKPTLHLLRPHMSALIQPPLVAQAVLRIYDRNVRSAISYHYPAEIEKILSLARRTPRFFRRWPAFYHYPV